VPRHAPQGGGRPSSRLPSRKEANGVSASLAAPLPGAFQPQAVPAAQPQAPAASSWQPAPQAPEGRTTRQQHQQQQRQQQQQAGQAQGWGAPAAAAAASSAQGGCAPML
jgi:hypothetical protein